MLHEINWTEREEKSVVHEINWIEREANSALSEKTQQTKSKRVCYETKKLESER